MRCCAFFNRAPHAAPFAEAERGRRRRAKLWLGSGAAAFTARGSFTGRALAPKARAQRSSRGPRAGARGVTNAAEETVRRWCETPAYLARDRWRLAHAHTGHSDRLLDRSRNE